MGYSTSVNITRDFGQSKDYIVTANAKQVAGKIVNHFVGGNHSFCLIGSYGTGKSSFILELENCLMGRPSTTPPLFRTDRQFNGHKSFGFINIVGEYASFSSLLGDTIDAGIHNVFEAFDKFYQKKTREGKFLVVVVDEFGKVLEHAAKNNPEKEMYFLQKFCEYVNGSDKNILFLTTLHQGFGAYAKGLSELQRQEWTKVKGRLVDIVFSEPVEQLLNLVAVKMSANHESSPRRTGRDLYRLAVNSRFVGRNLQEQVADSLFPMDIFAAYVMTLANQKYGQNERTLFAFLNDKTDQSHCRLQGKRQPAI